MNKGGYAVFVDDLAERNSNRVLAQTAFSLIDYDKNYFYLTKNVKKLYPSHDKQVLGLIDLSDPMNTVYEVESESLEDITISFYNTSFASNPDFNLTGEDIILNYGSKVLADTIKTILIATAILFVLLCRLAIAFVKKKREEDTDDDFRNIFANNDVSLGLNDTNIGEEQAQEDQQPEVSQ